MRTLRLPCTAAILLLATVAAATTIHVPADQPTIQAGINAASSGDTVVVACGTYYEHDIVVRPGVSVMSEAGEPDCVTIDALQSGRVFHCQAAGSTTTLVGLTITGGYCIGGAGPGGAGLLCITASPTVIRCTFKGNEVDGHGGGVDYRDSSSGQFIDCLFIDNTSSLKGGGARCYHSSPTFDNCRFQENQGDCGGGLYCSVGSPTLLGCVFEENMASSGGDGGGVRIFDRSHPYLDGCVFVGNKAGWGGGFACNESCSPLLTGCTFAGNTAWVDGSAFDSYHSSSPSVHRCIFAFGASGAAVYVDGASEPLLICTNIYGNAGGDWTGAIASQQGVSGNISLDPLFCDSANGDLSLCEDSPCLPGNHPTGSCDLIGAFDAGCGPCGAVAVESMSWGQIKSLYR